MQQQMLQDEAVLDLAESLREMVGVANECPDLPVISGTSNILEEIGRTALQVASLIDEYTKLPFLGGLNAILSGLLIRPLICS
jgi:hypothetical protein